MRTFKLLAWVLALLSASPVYASNLKASSTYHTVTNSGGMWDDFKVGVPGIYVSYDNEFISYVADEFTVTEVDAGSNSTDQTILDLANGWFRIKGAGNDNDGAQLQLGGTANSETIGESFAAVAGKKMYFEARFSMSETTQSDIFLGLHSEDTTIIASRGAEYIGFRKDDADALLDFESDSASSAATEITSLTTMSDTSVYKVGFKVNGTDSIEVWLNDNKVGTVSTSIPTTLMKLSIAYLNGEAAEDYIDLDYIRIYQER